MFKNLKRPIGLGIVVVVAAVSLGAYAFTASNTFDSGAGGGAGVATATISGYAISNVSYTQDSTDPSTWSAVDFNLDSDATQVHVKFDDSHGVITSSGWIDCTAGSSTIQHVSPFAVHCELPGVASGLDTLTVSAAR